MNSIVPNQIKKLLERPELTAVPDCDATCDVFPMLVARVDAHERYCFTNQAFDEWFGLKPRQIYGQTLREVLGEEGYIELQPRIAAAFAGTEQLFRSAIWHHDGTRRPAQIQYIPRFRAEGGLDGVCILMTDISGRLQSEEQMLKLNWELERRVQERTAQLQAANRELEAFCYSVSHDLRAPLRAVRGFTEVLMDQYAGQLDSRGQDFLRRASDASMQMDKLVEALLKLSRLSREVRKYPIDLSPLAEEIVSGLRKEEPTREVEITISAPLPVHGDERLMQAVLENLLRNAWKFTSKTSPARIELGRIDDPEPTFFVRDNGVGFDMTYVSRLFGVFQRLHSPSDFPGSGVGLAIVQRVINRHGGRVWAEGAPNAGATFYFTLPPANDIPPEQC